MRSAECCLAVYGVMSACGLDGGSRDNVSAAVRHLCSDQRSSALTYTSWLPLSAPPSLSQLENSPHSSETTPKQRHFGWHQLPYQDTGRLVGRILQQSDDSVGYAF